MAALCSRALFIGPRFLGSDPEIPSALISFPSSGVSQNPSPTAPCWLHFFLVALPLGVVGEDEAANPALLCPLHPAPVGRSLDEGGL